MFWLWATLRVTNYIHIDFLSLLTNEWFSIIQNKLISLAMVNYYTCIEIIMHFQTNSLFLKKYRKYYEKSTKLFPSVNHNFIFIYIFHDIQHHFTFLLFYLSMIISNPTMTTSFMNCQSCHFKFKPSSYKRSFVPSSTPT
jgi:hypothetical protein